MTIRYTPDSLGTLGMISGAPPIDSQRVNRPSEKDLAKAHYEAQLAAERQISTNTSDLAEEKPRLENWQDYSNCLGIDPDLFFPERGASTKEAKEACKACVVREECIEYALETGQKFGIWGGMSERERRRMRRQRALSLAASVTIKASGE